MVRDQHHPRQDRAYLEVSARHGHRRRTCRHQPDESEASAFAVSSYIVGVAGALFVFLWRGAAEPNLFDIPLSFRVLFIAIIGGLGSILGNYLGAILIVGLPVIIGTVPAFFGLSVSSAMVEHLNIMTIGALIIIFLIVEPHGLARFWAIIREKLIMWPFPH